MRSPLLDVDLTVDVSDLEIEFDPANLDVRRLADLGPRFSTDDVADIRVDRAEQLDGRYMQLRLRLPEPNRLARLARVLSKDVVLTIAHDPQAGSKDKDWTPPNGTWGDGGRFFNEAAEFFDPIQGAVANCYFIAALSAVAWARPYQIRHMTRATGLNNQQFTNMIRFYKPDSNGALDKEIEVADMVPLSASGNFIYARSSEVGETWPAIYEKAFAKLETGTMGDQPDITATGWGDCVWATAQLTGQKRYYYGTEDRTGDQLWDLVRANSMSYRTVNPMTAATYSSGTATDKKIVYSDANIVASHCYTVLGWAYRDGRKYIVLRNPWGNTEASVQTLDSTIYMRDISWWRPIVLTAVDGVFAIEANAFQRYFSLLGVAK